jgi:hypothetical protein
LASYVFCGKNVRTQSWCSFTTQKRLKRLDASAGVLGKPFSFSKTFVWQATFFAAKMSGLNPGAVSQRKKG